MLMSLGGVRFEVAPTNIHAVDHAHASDFAFKPVAGAAMPAEYVGEGAETFGLSGKLFPKKLGGLNDLDGLYTSRKSGVPQYLMRGDGRPMGWVLILSVSEKSTYLAADGVGQVIEFDLSLRKDVGPTAGSFFSTMARLFL